MKKIFTTAKKHKFPLSLGIGKNEATAASHFGKPGNSSSNKERNKDLEIFHIKGTREPSLPSLSTLLSSNIKDSELLSKIDEPQPQFTAKKYVDKGDIFVSNNVKGGSNVESHERRSEYDISHMFSDGLSDAENVGEKFSYASDSQDSDIDVLQGRRKREETRTTLANMEPGTFDLRSNSWNQKRMKQPKRTSFAFKMKNSLPEIKKRKKSAQRDTPISSSSLGPKKKDFGTATLLHSSVDELERPVIREVEKIVEPFVIRVKKGATSPVNGMFGSDNRSPLDLFERGNSDYEIIDDSEIDTDSVASSVNSAFSKCSFKVIDSKDSSPPATQSLNKHETTTYDDLRPSDLIRDTLEFTEDEFADNASRVSSEVNLSEDLVKIGSQLSGCSKLSLYSSEEEGFKLSPRYATSPECKSPITQGNFNISQSQFLKKRRPFMNLKKSNDVTKWKFKLCNSAEKEIEENRGECQLSTFAKSDSRTCLKRQHPSETKFNLLNLEINNTYNRCEREEPASRNIDKIPDKFSGTRYVSNFSGNSTNKRSSQLILLRTSDELRSFVREWVDRQNEMNSESEGNLMSKRRRLDEDRETIMVEENIDIDPESLFSNYSCEYNEEYITGRFKPERNFLQSNNTFE